VAEQRKANAQHNLGMMYQNGEGVPQDFVQTNTWFNLTPARVHSQAEKERGNVAKIMTPFEIAEAQRLATEWKPIGCALKLPKPASSAIF
jgi:hypothetical protein